MKPKITVHYIGSGWVTRFTIGVQTFTIDNGKGRTKKEALWYKKMLKNAFDNLG